MPAAIARRRLLLLTAVLGFAGVAAAFYVLETPGLGIAHLFSLPIALTALVTGARAGAGAGALATIVYAALSKASSRVDSDDVLTVSGALLGLSFVAGGALIGWVAGSKRALVAQLHELAQRDFLTGLLNLRAFGDALDARCAGKRPFALVLADVDGLKEVNDRGGHAAGNMLLRRAADALVTVADETDDIARIGGDEFALLASVDVDDVESLCARVAGALERASVAVSLGWAVCPDDAPTPLALFRRADVRLYRAKEVRTDRGITVLEPGRRATG